MKASRSRAVQSVLLTLSVAVLLAGCSRGFYREDVIARDAGNSSATNQVKMAVSMSPPSARRKNIQFDGQRMSDAISVYRSSKGATTPGTAAGPSADAPQQDRGLVDEL